MTTKNDISSRRANLSPEMKALLEKRLRGDLKSTAKAQTIPRRPEGTPVQLSFAQERLWFLYQLEPDSPAYNMPTAVRFNGPLNVTALEQSLDEIVRRHEALRTTFSTEQGQPLQVVTDHQPFTLSVEDLQHYPEAEREERLRQLTHEEANRPFDLTQDPLIRARLLCLGPEDFVLLLTVHHIVFDEWSDAVLWRELTALYNAFVSGDSATLPALPVQYADFAQWQRELLQNGGMDQQLAYWKNQLSGELPLLQLPADRPRPAVQAYRGANCSLELSPTLVESLHALIRTEDVTMFMIGLAAFYILLHRYTGQDNLLVGSPVANRNRVELENLVGFLVNTVVLRTDMTGNPTFRELLGRVREVALEAYDHQDLPFEKLVEELQPERDLSYNPLFQVMFNIVNQARIPQFSNLALSYLDFDIEGAQFDLTLNLIESEDSMMLSANYNADLFLEDRIVLLLRHYETLLASIVADPDQPIAALPMLTAVEQQRLTSWNDTRRTYPQDKCIHQLFEEQVKQAPAATAVQFDSQQLTYQELNQRANQLAHYLQTLGVGPETLVGICLERSLELVVGLLAILKAGGAYVPLDPDYPAERLTFMLADSQAPILLTREKLLDKLVDVKSQVICFDRDWQRIAQEPVDNPESDVTAENLAYIIYTSGSTGTPKGVMIQHRSLVNYTESTALDFGITAADRVLQFISISFDACAEEIYPSLTRGATLVLRTESMISSIEAFIQKVAEWELTVMILPTAYLRELLNAFAAHSFKLPPSIRLVGFGGEKVLPEQITQWQKHVDRSVRLLNRYGPTEATVVATTWELNSEAWQIQMPQDVPIGHPTHNTQVYVLDRYLQPVGVGIPGELYIGGDGLARGYLNRPDLTAEKFINAPLIGKENGKPVTTRLYKTGDLVRWLPDGNLEFLGRIDHQVKIRGFRIELGEIESVLSQHPAIAEVVVMAREDRPGMKQLVAYIVVQEGQKFAISEVRDYLQTRLPDYMVPSLFELLARMPMTPGGKIDRKALPAPDLNSLERQKIYVAPRTPLEEKIAAIWADILHLERVGVHENFFDLGGHSLLATRVVSRLWQALDIEIPLRQLFENPTVAELSEYLQAIQTTAQNLHGNDFETITEDREVVEL